MAVLNEEATKLVKRAVYCDGWEYSAEKM